MMHKINQPTSTILFIVILSIIRIFYNYYLLISMHLKLNVGILESSEGLTISTHHCGEIAVYKNVKIQINTLNKPVA